MRGELAPGESLGKYEILRKLATGGMAEIYLARSTGTAGFEKLVVIKRILPSAAQDTVLVSMFLEEAKLAAKLRHPNIASVIDVAADGNSYFFAMEHVHGQDVRRVRLESQQRERPMPVAVALSIACGAAQALGYAHDVSGPSGPLGIVHRDVSPSNILVSYEGAVKLVDFGIARATGRTTKTLTGTLKGKLAYMSPEQCRGKQLDGRSDLFSLGVVLYELTCGVRPFDGPSDMEVLERIDQGLFEPPSQIIPSYPKALERIVVRLLSIEPGARYPNAHALLNDLEAQVAALGTFTPALGVAKYMNELFAEEITSEEVDDEVRTSPAGRSRHPPGRLPTAITATVTVGRTRTEQDPSIAMREVLAGLHAGSSPPLDPIARELLADLDASAPPTESADARTRRRIESLLECAFACHGVGDLQRAMIAIELANAEDPDSAVTNELFARHRATVEAVLAASGRRLDP
jgi:serine/threonine protein kinase